MIAREQDAAARAAWRAQMATCDPRSLVFLDETSTPTTMTPLWGRAPRGERAVGHVPRRRWEAVTLLATLTATGLGPGLQLPGTVDRDVFDAFVVTTLVPSLQPGQTVVMDTLAVHNSASARQAIEAAGCHLVFLPTYSPDFNPIEQTFATLKHLLRKAEARTVEAIMTATQQAYETLSGSDARGYFRAAGYNI